MTVKLTGVSDAVVTQGVYAGFYDLEVNGESLLGMCDDYVTRMHIGQEWEAEWLTYADVLAGKGKFTSTRGVTAYNRVGYLFSLLDDNDRSQRAQVHLAIWKIMAPNALSISGDALDYYRDAISGAHDNFNWSRVMRVLTPMPGYQVQEYLVSVPEPPVWWLLLAGLPIVLWLRRGTRGA